MPMTNSNAAKRLRDSIGTLEAAPTRTVDLATEVARLRSTLATVRAEHQKTRAKLGAIAVIHQDWADLTSDEEHWALFTRLGAALVGTELREAREGEEA